MTFRAYWFTPGTPLSVTVKRKSGKGKKRVKGTSFTARPKGKTAIKFKFPKVKWTGKTKVNVCGTPPGTTKQECAGRTVEIPKPAPLPKRVIKFTGGNGTFVIDCLKSQTCEGRLTIRDGKTTLVKPRRYTVKAGGQKKVRLRLTRAGKKALGKDGRAKGLGILTAPDGDKVKFTAILKRGRS